MSQFEASAVEDHENPIHSDLKVFSGPKVSKRVRYKGEIQATSPRLIVSAKAMVVNLALKTASGESPTRRIKFTKILALVEEYE